MKKIILIIMSICMYITTSAQLNVNVTTPGTLSSLVGNQTDNELIITGNIDARDIKFLTLIECITLNLSGTTINSYTGKYGTLYNVSYPYLANELPISSFENNRFIENLILPDSLRTINVRAFSHVNVSNLIIPSTLEKVEVNAFLNATNIETLDLSMVDTIEIAAFQGMTSLDELYVDPTVVIDPNAFGNAVVDSVITDLGTFPISDLINDLIVPDTTIVDTTVIDTIVIDTIAVIDIVQVIDTVTIEVEVTITDTIFSIVNDTLINLVHDTITIDSMVIDTLVIDSIIMNTLVVDSIINDTILNITHDTIPVTINDTVFSIIHDTIPITVYDTVRNYVHDIINITVNDTVTNIVYEPLYIDSVVVDTIINVIEESLIIDYAKTSGPAIWTKDGYIHVEYGDFYVYDLFGNLVAMGTHNELKAHIGFGTFVVRTSNRTIKILSQ